MKTSPGRRVSQPLSHRKSRDRALIVLLAGLILLTPPVAGIFELDVRIAGVPLALVYLFAVWAGLIAAAAALSRHLMEDAADGSDAQAPEPDGREADND